LLCGKNGWFFNSRFDDPERGGDQVDYQMARRYLEGRFNVVRLVT
jgi:hypothetical protein